MVKLVAKFATEGLLPCSYGGATLSAVEVTAITCFMPQAGADLADFKSVTGCSFPAPNRSTGKEGARAVWTGPDQAMFVGPKIDVLPGFAVTDQSDGWTVLRLSGDDAEAILARLVPVDLRRGVFKRGHTARTQLGHMALSLTRVGETRFDIMVFRSMTHTAVHEIDAVMRNLAARARIG